MAPPEVRLQLATIILAEELNFTRAAQRLNITQPALSKQIAELENHLGVPIFKRMKNRVELTEAGQVFVRACSEAFSTLERAIRLAKSTHDEIDPLVTVGHSPYTDPSLVSALLSIHLPFFPNLRLRMESMFAIDLAQSVLSSEIDIALIAEPTENSQLTRVKVATTPLYVAMPSEHRSSQRQSVAIKDLSGVGWMIFPRKADPVIYDRIIDVAKSSEVTPVELHHYLNPLEVPQLILENFGVAILAKGIAEQLQRADIVIRPLSDPTFNLSTYLVLRSDQSSRLVNEFGRAYLRKVAPNKKIDHSSGQLLLGL